MKGGEIYIGIEKIFLILHVTIWMSRKKKKKRIGLGLYHTILSILVDPIDSGFDLKPSMILVVWNCNPMI